MVKRFFWKPKLSSQVSWLLVCFLVVALLAVLLALVRYLSHIPFEMKSYDMSSEEAKRLVGKVGHCAVRQFQVDQLQGDWRLAYYKTKLPPNTSISVRLFYQDDGQLEGIMKSNLIATSKSFGFNLTRPNAEFAPGLLFSQVSWGSGDAGIGSMQSIVLILDIQPESFLAVWQAGSGNENTADWAIYVRPRVRSLDNLQLARIIQRLACLGISEHQKNAHLLFALQ